MYYIQSLSVKIFGYVSRDTFWMVIKPKFNRFSGKVVVNICVHIFNIQDEQYFTLCGVLWQFI